MPPERVDRLRRWHDEVSAELHRRGAHDVDYLGLRLHVPEKVFAPTPVSDLLGREVLAHVRPTYRVLDMGCGAGANALLAARVTDDVVAVDFNPHAVAATTANAERNGVASRVRCFESDVFSNVDGDFDLIVIDPPFRWFAPRDVLERAFTDENYDTLRRFLTSVRSRLRVDGLVLLSFGTSGDVTYLDELIDEGGLVSHTIAERVIHVRGEDATYFVRGLRPSPNLTRTT
jgi:release factor glutamine methyltransferase